MFDHVTHSPQLSCLGIGRAGARNDREPHHRAGVHRCTRARRAGAHVASTALLFGPMLLKPSEDAIHRLVRTALEEDAPWGDLTAQVLVPPSAQVNAQLVAREAGVLCGEDLFRAAMSLTDPAITTTFTQHDADHFAAGALLATVSGPARAILQAGGAAVDFVQG